MPTVIGHHDVKDTEHWLASPKREEVFGPLGVTNIRTFVSPDDPTKVAVLMDIAEMDAVMSFMQTQEAADAMAYDGVLPETLVFFVKHPPGWGGGGVGRGAPASPSRSPALSSARPG